MSDIHAVEYEPDSEGNLKAPQMGTVETRDYVLACILGTLGIPMRGYAPVAVVFNANNIAETLSKPGKGNLNLCRVTFTFFYEGPNHAVYGPMNFHKVVAAYTLARLMQRKRRGDESPEIERMLVRAHRAIQRYQVHEWLVYEVAQLIDLASNIFVLGETVKELSHDPMLTVVRNLAKPGGLMHVAQPLNHEKSVMAKREFYGKV